MISQNVADIYHEIGNTALNTRPVPWTLISIIVAFVGVYFSAMAMYYSRKTARNVERVDTETQMELFKDLIRHLYRNKVVTLAMTARMKADDYTKHPSEEHFLKLKTLPEDIHLEQYNKNPRNYAKMHEMGLLSETIIWR